MTSSLVANGMRVRWVHQNFVASGHAGHARAIYNLSALLERGWAVDLVTPDHSYQEDASLPQDARDQVVSGKLSWHRVAIPNYGPARRGRAYLAFLRQAMRLERSLPRPDLVFCSTPPLSQAVSALYSVWRHRVPLVLEVRDLWPAVLVEVGLLRNRFAVGGFAAAESLAYRMAAQIVSTSPGFRPYLEAMGVPPERIVVAPHGAPCWQREHLASQGHAYRRANGL
ncbi:MAG: glycosyltransferase [Pseudomonadota bacterium]